MGVDGIIILDSHRRAIIQSGFRANSTAYPSLHIDAVKNAISNATHPDDIDPVIYVSTSDGPSACCHVPCGDMRLLCPISKNEDPLYAFAFLSTFTDILREYFGTVLAAGTLTDNFDVVYQLLEETLDSGGHPLTTLPNALRDIVIPPSLLSKLLNVAGANINPTLNSASGPFSSPIPWRKAGIRHNNNEVYFDIIEELSGIVNKHGTTIASNVWGRIETNAKLSGTPDISLTFANPRVLSDCAFHPCVRLQRWTRDHTLSFVPPDGRFTLLDYRYAPDTTSASVAAARDNVAIPFAIKANINASGSIDLVLSSKMSTHSFEGCTAEICLGKGASGLKIIATRVAGGYSNSKGNTSSWTYDTRRHTLKWEIPTVPPSSNWSLKGTFNPSLNIRPTKAIRIQFGLSTHTFSALKVDSLKVLGESYKPYKGVRGRSMVDVEWRW